MSDMNPVDLSAVEQLAASTDAIVREALAVASKRTEGGKGIDNEQPHCERLAYAATEVAAARELVDYARRCKAAKPDPAIEGMAAVFVAETAHKLTGQLDAHSEAFGINDD